MTNPLKVTKVETETPVLFSQLNPGCAFIHNTYFYIKIKPLPNKDENALCLDPPFALASFFHNDKVYPRESELILKK